MIGWLRRVVPFLDRRHAAESVVPADPEHARTLEQSRALLRDPRIRAILSERDRHLRDSFQRADRRLQGR